MNFKDNLLWPNAEPLIGVHPEFDGRFQRIRREKEKKQKRFPHFLSCSNRQNMI